MPSIGTRMRFLVQWFWLSSFALASLGGCDAPPAGSDAGRRDAGMRAPASVGPVDRPARLFAPPAYDGATELPLVVLLHGYTINAMLQDLYFGLTGRARRGGFYLLLPDGTLDEDGEPHWDVGGRRVDDHAYLRGLIEEVVDLVPVDRSQITLIGHSNGGFMAYRLACDSADLITGIASLAGSNAVPGCEPSRDVAVLQIHGTADEIVLYDGGLIAGLEYGSAPAMVEAWAVRVGCDPMGATAGARLDLVSDIDGAETEPLVYSAGCRAGVELWTMEGAVHIPALTSEFTPSVLAWLGAHRR